RLGADAASLIVEDGTVTAPGGGSVAYWELVAGDELHVEATGAGTPKTPDQYRLVGQPTIRLDIPGIMTGETVFLHDLRPEGMVYARAVYPPGYDATLVNVATAPVEAMPGVIAVVRNGNFMGVIAERLDQAEAAGELLETIAQY